MKKILLSLTGLFLLAGLNAQITLTASEHNPVVGDSFEQKIYSSPPESLGFGPSGGDVTWDFSALNSTNTADVNIQQANTPNYPNSDIYYNQSGSSSYFKTSGGNFTYMGVTTSFANVKYNDGEDQVRFPMNYGDTYTDSASGTLSGYTSGTREVEIEVMADGWGTLKTPEATYNDAMRVQIIRNTTDYISGAPTTSTDSIYYWYTTGVRFPVMTFFRSYSGGSSAAGSMNWLGSSSVGLNENDPFESVDIYPNPAKDQLRVKGLKGKDYKLEVISNKGNVLHSLENRKTIPLGDFAAGNYTLKISDNEGNFSIFTFLKI